jgi:hypothetical protein
MYEPSRQRLKAGRKLIDIQLDWKNFPTQLQCTGKASGTRFGPLLHFSPPLEHRMIPITAGQQEREQIEQLRFVERIEKSAGHH